MGGRDNTVYTRVLRFGLAGYCILSDTMSFFENAVYLSTSSLILLANGKKFTQYILRNRLRNKEIVVERI